MKAEKNHKKIRVLLIWFEKNNRPELLDPFITMSNEVEFFHLFFRTAEERDIDTTPFNRIYWFNYNTPQSLLNNVKPDVVLGTTESLLCISLIRTCKKRNIPYIGLQHGFVPETIFTILPKVNRPTIFSLKILQTYFKTFAFYFASFSLLKPSILLQGITVFKDFFTKNTLAALKKNRHTWLVPETYVCFSPYSSEHYKEMYNLAQCELIYTGVICFDNMFKQIENLKKNTSPKRAEKYYLLIDTNFEEYVETISREQINGFYRELAEFCFFKNARLAVKLHPWSYEYKDLLQHQNIDYYRNMADEDLNTLIFNAEGCLGFFSTLSFPIIAIKELIQIRYDNVYIKPMADLKITEVLDFYTITKNDIHFNDGVYTPNPEGIKFMLYNIEGNATEKLKSLVLQKALQANY